MQNRRRHKRYKLDIVEINGRMSLADKVKIIDISLGGIAVKADRRLNIGREYVIRLEDKGRSIDVRGIVVRSELSGIEERDKGEQVSIYTAGMLFKEGQVPKITEFLNSIAENRKKEAPVAFDRRLTVRFNITAPGEQTLSFPAQFTVREISLSGMLIRTDQKLAQESMIPMALSLNADSHVTFNGRVASCRSTEYLGQPHYEIGVAFSDLTEKDRALIQAFIDYLTSMEDTSPAGP